MPISLGALATQFGCELIGDPNTEVSEVASLHGATSRSLSFLSNASYLDALPDTQAAVVVLQPKYAELCNTNAFVCDNPYAMYARMAAAVCPEPVLAPGVHASAVVAESATLGEGVHVGANVVIGDRVTIGDNSAVGPGTVIGSDCTLGSDCQLIANVSLVRDVILGDRCIVHPGAVIGADGFGNAMTPDGWVKVPQLGGVKIGNDVEVGANSTIDRGAIGDTLIGNGVRIDNLVMIAHNVTVGDHTAMAAMTGIAGSTTIGKRCMFAGKGGAVGHVNICDDVVVAAKSFVTKDVTKPGTYAASFPAENAKDWARNVARFRRLGSIVERLKKLEK